MAPQRPRRILLPLPVAQVIKVASVNGIAASAVIGNDRVMQFYADGLITSIHMSPDLETFGPHSVMRLVEFFRDRLSVQAFWPE